MTNIVNKLNNNDVPALTQDARVMAIRWDLTPWSLVLDLNVRDSEAVNAPISRAWLIFTGISELTWPLNNTRLPNGCFLTSEMSVCEEQNDFRKYSFWGMLPSHSENGAILKPASQIIDIKAKGVIGLCSVKKVQSKTGFIERNLRLSLASDDEMLAELSNYKDAS